MMHTCTSPGDINLFSASAPYIKVLVKQLGDAIMSVKSLDQFLEVRQDNGKRYPVVPYRYDMRNPFGRIGVQPPLTVIDGKNIRVHEVIMGIILFHKEPPATILDPTCGEENYMFSPWLRDGTLQRLGYKYIAMDKKPVGMIQYDLFDGLPIIDDNIDIIVYDPPYLPSAREDKRGNAYDIDDDRAVDEIKRYYSKQILAEFHRVLKSDGILIVKGADFYYPLRTDNLYLFTDIVDYKPLFRPIALYIYRFFYSEITLTRYRTRNWKRPLVIHTYFLVLVKN